MRLATIISLGASTTLGIGALLVARVWMPSHAAHAATLPPVPAPAVEGVPVVVAAQPIPYGVKLEAKYLTVAKLPATAVPAGAYSSVNQILSQQDGPPTSLTPIQAQEAVLPSKLTGIGERATLAALITPGMRAYTIAINEVSGTGGHIMPGDRVDVVVTREVGAQGGPNLGGQRVLMSGLAVQNLKVLGIDQNANPTTATPVVARSVTLEVSVQDAERLALSAQAGTLSLALRKTGAMDVEPVRSVLVNELGGSGQATARPHDPAQSGARRHVAAHALPGKPADDGPTMIVVAGDTASKIKVAADKAAVAFP